MKVNCEICETPMRPNDEGKCYRCKRLKEPDFDKLYKKLKDVVEILESQGKTDLYQPIVEKVVKEKKWLYELNRLS